MLLPRKHQITNLHDRKLYAVAFILFAFNLALSFLIPITADEAYYRLWAQHPALSYFDHPPMVAYLLALSIKVFGDGIFGIRFFPLVFSTIVPFLWLSIFHKERDAMFYAVLWASPVLQVVLFFMTPDVPFFFFSTLFIFHYLRKGKPDFFGGLLLGLALLSKYMAVLLYPALLVYAFRRDRFRFLLYFGVLPLVMFMPVVLFNVTHDFVPFKYQLAHGSGGFALNPPYFVKYILDVAFAGGVPISIIGMLSMKRLLSENKGFLFYLGLSFFIFFAFFSFFSRQEANWPLLFYPVMLYVGYVATLTQKRRLWLLILYFMLSLPLKPLLLFSPVKSRIFHKETVIKDIAEEIRDTNLPVFANTYQHASLLSYYLERFVPSLNIKSRPNQFDLWERKIPEGKFIFVAIGYPDVMSRFIIDSTLYVKDNISVYIVRSR